ncbi:FAD-binding domain-containing protein [Chryseomicrobium sp. FSL W7-1435]|uniref:FAD-binding domain-containing protein n=1 Tax=Chryseomicrobium sp. FSL W7-1435 TaxID=2921704 RepID=UPI00315B005B
MQQIVWLKRDLRIEDHAPLQHALSAGPTLVLYVAEPSIWKEPDLSLRHFHFVVESLQELEDSIHSRGGKIGYFIGEMQQALEHLYQEYEEFRLLTHMEHGTPATFRRDLLVHKWMNGHGLVFKEFSQNGIVRAKKTLVGLEDQWESYMAQEVIEAPDTILPPNQVPSSFSTQVDCLHDFQVKGKALVNGQKGGTREGLQVLESFLATRFPKYHVHISKPWQAQTSSSRLSPYLAWGNLSMRQVVQASRAKHELVTNIYEKRALDMFEARLRWQGHFIQRFEFMPELAATTLNPAFDSARTAQDEELFRKWYYGQTGIPMVDAAMRALHETGWIHFRSRAMVLSFVCNTLRFDWRRPAHGLAQLFIDYDPGIHFNQIQMQAGSSGFHTIRIYNPVKMGQEQDPDGKFIRRYVPELRSLSNTFIHEPWLSPHFSQLNYPEPVVNVHEANRSSRELFYSIKNHPDTKARAEELLALFGSSRSSRPQTRRSEGEQLTLSLEEEQKPAE